MKKEIYTICLPCGRRNDKKHKIVMGAWIDTCDMCGAKDVPCASAAHDFGIYMDQEQKTIDKVQDVI